MKAIFSADKNWGIGNKGELLLRLSKDMQNFKQLTMGHPVIMGRKTYLSLPKGALPGRRNIVLSKSGFAAPDVEVAQNVQALLQLLGNGQEAAFVIGGGEIYKLLLPYTDTMYVTKFDAVFEADTYFADVDALPGWVQTYKSEPMEEKGTIFWFCAYAREIKI